MADEKPKPPRPKKPYEKPRVESAKAYEKKALACGKQVIDGDPQGPDCTIFDYS